MSENKLSNILFLQNTYQFTNWYNNMYNDYDNLVSKFEGTYVLRVAYVFYVQCKGSSCKRVTHFIPPRVSVLV